MTVCLIDVLIINSLVFSLYVMRNLILPHSLIEIVKIATAEIVIKPDLMKVGSGSCSERIGWPSTA